MKKTSRSRRVFELLTYCVIGIAFATGAILYGVYTAEKGISPKLPIRWVGLFAATLLTFGYPIRWYRKHWRCGQFWAALLGLLTLHLLTYTLVLLRVDEWPLIAFAIITPVEWLFIYPILNWAAGSG